MDFYNITFRNKSWVAEQDSAQSIYGWTTKKAPKRLFSLRQQRLQPSGLAEAAI
jgi:hypothetical protein